MITDNLKKSFTGLGTYDVNKVPIPYSGDAGSGGEESYGNSARNIWNNNGPSVMIFQHCFLSMCSATGSNPGKFAFRNYNYKRNATGDGNLNGYWVDIGFGNTAESATDYALADSNADMTTPTLTHQSGAVYTGETLLDVDRNNGVIVRAESVYLNNTNNDVVVKEIGLVVTDASNGISSFITTGWQKMHFLIARKVLATPVTIHPGETYKFIYRLKF